MFRKNITTRIIAVSILLAGVIALLVVGNITFVKANPGGMDFLAHWQGTRSFLKNGTDPYSDQAAAEINSLVDGLGIESTGEYRFVSPLISFIVLVPFSLPNDFAIARAVWMTFLEVILLASGWLVTKWIRMGRPILKILIVFISTMLFYPVVKAVLDGSLAVVCFALIIMGTYMLIRHQDEAAGVLFALTLVKPDMVYPLLVALLVWAAINRRTRLIWWLLSSVVLFVGFTMVLIPSWPISYAQSIVNYSATNPVRMTELAPTALNIRLLLLKNLTLLGLVIYELVIVRIKSSKRLLWFVSLVLILTPWVGGAVRIEHLMLIMPALFIGLGFILDFWKGKGRVLIFTLPLLLMIFSWVFSGTILTGISPAWNRLFLNVVIPFVALLGIYWSKWWVIRQEKFALEEITK